MTMLRAAVRAHWRESAPAEAMARINRTVFENTPGNRYVTFFLAVLDIETGALSYVNAGHNPGLLQRADGAIELLHDGGVVLGMFENATYEAGATALHAGDTLLLYSDGVTETWNDREEEFGEAGLRQVMENSRGLAAAALEAEVVRGLDSFAPNARATDDRTLLILKRL
jgi:sigma-B regulation protein RsbU (phosphoserine phosphatase)